MARSWDFRMIGPRTAAGDLQAIWQKLYFYFYFSSAKHPLFLFILLRPVRDAPPWGTWLWTVHWWRKVGREGRRRKKHSTLQDLNSRPPDYQAWALLLCYSCCPGNYLFLSNRARNALEWHSWLLVMYQGAGYRFSPCTFISVLIWVWTQVCFSYTLFKVLSIL